MPISRTISLFATLVISVGLVVAAFVGVGPISGLTVFACLAFVYGGAYLVARLRSGEGDIAAIVSGRADERQGQIDQLAGVLSCATALVLCGVGAIISLANGDGSGGPFAWILAASGVVYIVSLLVLRTRV
ncbi:MAG: hypothetical protein AB7N24_18710 [Dehalococcoidia bacterium]